MSLDNITNASPAALELFWLKNSANLPPNLNEFVEMLYFLEEEKGKLYNKRLPKLLFVCAHENFTLEIKKSKKGYHWECGFMGQIMKGEAQVSVSHALKTGYEAVLQNIPPVKEIKTMCFYQNL